MMNTCRLPLVLFFLALGWPCVAQIPNDSIISDFRHFIDYLEETHPDPYTNYGGRALFRRSAFTALQELKQRDVTTAEELCWHIRTFLAPLHDGHTYVNYPAKQNASHTLAPIAFRTIDEGLFVRKLPIAYQHLLGSRLVGIEGIPAGTLYQEITIPSLKHDSITYQLKTPDNHDIEIRLPFMQEKEWKISHSLAFLETFVSGCFQHKEAKKGRFLEVLWLCSVLMK